MVLPPAGPDLHGPILRLPHRQERDDELPGVHHLHLLHRPGPLGGPRQLRLGSELLGVLHGDAQHRPVHRGIDRRAVHHRAGARDLLQAALPPQRRDALAHPAALAAADDRLQRDLEVDAGQGQRGDQSAPPGREPAGRAVADQYERRADRGHHRQHLARHPLQHDHLVQRAPGHPRRALRGGLPRRRRGVEGLQVRDLAAAQARGLGGAGPRGGLHPQGPRHHPGLTGGGPSNATQTLATQSYKLSFANFEFGQGAALGNILVLVSVVFAVVYLRLSRSGEGS